MYTKGEWFIYTEFETPEIMSKNKKIAIVCRPSMGITKETEANAQLIASAPKMYEACKFTKLHTSGEYFKAGRILSGEDVAILQMIQDKLNEDY